MSSSELSELSSSPLTDDDELERKIPKGKLDYYFKVGAAALPPKLKKKRAPSPPHEYVLADNPDIAFICMFRSRFSNAFSKSLPHYGPQDIERGVVDSPPGEHVERLLCALLGLLLNRKKEVEKGHYSRALEEAIAANKSQWAAKWESKNPLHGGGNFNNMNPEQRLTLLRTLILWSLDSSDAIKAMIKDSYKQSRHDDDLNQPLSVQPWGKDGDKRRYWLIEGQDDTHFRLYRESNPALKTVTWRSMAGDIDELVKIAANLKEEGSNAAVRLHDRIMAAKPRFEASEDKRRRRDYRTARRAQFTRPEPGFSLYEGRTRGKRPRYTYSDEEGDSDAVSARRSTRQSGVSTPAEPSAPTFTASGRQVKSRLGGAYGESMLSGQADALEHASSNGVTQTDEDDHKPSLRGGSGPRVKARPGKHIEGYNELDEMDDESDAPSSGNDWDSGADDEPEDPTDEEEEDIEMSDDDGIIAKEEGDVEDDRTSQSLMVSLRYSKLGSSPISANATNGTPATEQNTPATFHHHHDTQPAVSPMKVNEHAQPAAGSARPLPVNVTSHSMASSNQRPSTEYSASSSPQPVRNTLQASSVLPTATQVKPTFPADETLEESEAGRVGDLPNFRQYQYQPSTG